MKLGVEVILAICTIASAVYWILCLIAANRFYAASESEERGKFPPVSVMIPLCGADFQAYETFSSFCRQQYPVYQIVFGVLDSEDSSIPFVRKLQEEFPHLDISLCINPKVYGANLKVSNLINMSHLCKHEILVIVDSDVRVKEDYLRLVTLPLQDSSVGLVTTLYRASHAVDFASKLEAIGITSEFAAGVLVARMLEGMKFALGATMATTCAKLESIGGFLALSDFLADDYMFGNLMAKTGFEVRLSSVVVETVLRPGSFSAMLRHQLRWARNIRISRPLGYLGLVLTYGTTLGLLNVCISGGSVPILILFATAFVLRMIMAWIIGVRHLQDRLLKRFFWMIPVRDLFSFVIWCLSWLGKTVEWRGRFFTVHRDGSIVEVTR